MSDGKDLVERIESRHGLRRRSYMKKMGMGNDLYRIIDPDHDEKVITAAEAAEGLSGIRVPDRRNDSFKKISR